MSHPLTVELSDVAYATLRQRAREASQTPAELAAAALEQHFAPASLPEPRDDWERHLRSAATDCGVSLSNEAVGSEGLYD